MVGDPEGYWFFKGNRCIKTDRAGTKTLAGGESKITAPEAWPIFQGTDLAEGNFDAVTWCAGSDAGYWFFKGDMCAKTNEEGDEWLEEPCNLTDSQSWPLLKDH
ncbi:hypothetical protein FHX37_2655 [Haloactinospora alba]|uniref:Hemopexin n=2 Tax=Haloactinospora alba TaxID=405555 RepID=A0A543NLF8_9ACTN|nr:hypothetical protein FHX37_2655 [Haloactinospora alba]